MKKLFTLAMAIGCTVGLNAQNYNYGSSTGTAAPFTYNTAGTSALAIPASDILSSWQTMPFSWDFYGSAVSGYYISDNGYITFDQNATTSDPNNVSIPDAGGPNNAIYAFWDDLDIISGSGSTDEVRTWTYGTTPNRVHVVEWYSVTPQGGSGFMYSVIRMHECGDFDIIHNYGNVTGMSGTVGCEDATGANGTMIAGPNASFPSVGSAGADDEVYTFYWDGISYDMSVSSTGLNGTATPGSQTLNLEVWNNGSMAATNFDLHYSVDGGAAQTMNVTQTVAANGGSAVISHTIPWTGAVGGTTYNICAWIDNINGNADERTCNDQVCESIFASNGTTATRNVLIEEFTGAWCGWCPDGAVVMQDILDNNPGRAIGVSVHDGDAMEYSEGIRSGFGVSAYPNGMVDRKVFPGEPDEPHSRGAWTANANAQLTEYTPVEVSIAQSYNSSTRVLDIDVTADFVDYASGDMRIVLELIEDSVTGTGTGYDQTNYLNTTAGHPYENAGDPIVGYIHRHTLRANPAGAFGNSGVIPATVAPSDSYTESFSYTIPANYDETKMSIVAFVAYYSTTVGQREVMNAAEEHVGISVGMQEDAIVNGIEIFPNPAGEQATLVFNTGVATDADVVVYNAFGEVVRNLQSSTLAAGEHRIEVPTHELAAGIYFVTINTGNKAYTRRLIVR